MSKLIICKGLLFDLDGTLVNSLAVVEKHWCLFADRFGIDRAEILAFIHGKQAIASLRHFMPGASEAQIMREFSRMEQAEATDMEGVNALPGALDLLSRLDEIGIPWGIVTSGTIPIATARSRAAGISLPETLVTAERVQQGKPAAEPYLLGASKLGLSPAHCVVVEDAQAGIQSGLNAGCPVVAVDAPAGLPELTRVALALDSLQQMQVKRQGSDVIVEKR